jgi:hypothetical protein
MAPAASRYLPRLRIRVEHDYYANGFACGLHFEPDADTAAWLATHDCAWRDTGSGIELAAPTPREGPPAPAATMTWFVRCDDRPFATVTAHLPRNPDRVLHFQLPPGASGTTEAVQTLHAGPHASLADASPTHPPGVLAGMLSSAHKARLPAFVVRVPAPLLSSPTGTEARYRIAFEARTPVWKYCLLGDWGDWSDSATDPLRVEDSAQQTTFTEAVAEVLDNGQSALSIRSRGGIALRERADNRFQLRSRSAVADRVLVKRLPVAGADHFARETIDGVPTLVSEIFVHR